MNSTAGNCSISGAFPLLIVAVVLPLALAAGIYRQRKEAKRLSGLAGHLGAAARGGKIIGRHNAIDYEIRYLYAGKHRRLYQVQICAPFQGYPFKIRKENYADEILLHLSRKFEDHKTGDADFDKRFRVGVSQKHSEWMRGYTGVPGRLDALQWFFQNGYGSVHSDGGRLYASYTHGPMISGGLENESHPVWDPLFIRRTLNALDHAAKLDQPVVYESWEEWGRRIQSHGFRFEGRQFTVLAILAAVLAAMAIYLISSLRNSGPTV